MPRREQRRSGVFARRALIIGAGQLAAFGLLAERLWQMQVVDASRYRTLAEKNRISARLLAPVRGRILDRFGIAVADNRQVWRALLIAGETRNVEATLDAFDRIVGLSPYERTRIQRDLRQHRRYVPVMLRSFLTWDEMAKIEANAPDLPGVTVDVGDSRLYPYGRLLAHTVGYVARPNEKDVARDPELALPGMRIGRIGLEAYGDASLRGTAGVEQLEVNALGRVIRELDRQEGTPGADLKLSLDAGLQADVRAALGEEAASAVVMDATNGEVLAMVSTPSFDPSVFDKGVSQAQWNDWVTNERSPLTDRATEGLYPPGSTFKPTVALAALRAGSITPDTVVDCPGFLDVGNRRFHCWKKGGHGTMNLHLGIKNSCDVYFYVVAMKTGIDPIAAMAHRMGLAVPLGLEIPGARTGFFPDKKWSRAHHKPWTMGDTVIHGIGQGYTEITPVSLATMVSRIATGRAVEPRLVRANVPASWPVLGLDETWLKDVRAGMWAVVNEPHGTAPLAKLDIPGVTLAGKTGSAQVINVSRAQRDAGYDSSKMPWKLRPHALFIAYAPYEAPRYATAVVIEHGNAGADAAAPVAKVIMESTLRRDPSRRNTAPDSAPPSLAAQGAAVTADAAPPGTLQVGNTQAGSKLPPGGTQTR
jgi:penicillin-binding protein 2